MRIELTPLEYFINFVAEREKDKEYVKLILEE